MRLHKSGAVTALTDGKKVNMMSETAKALHCRINYMIR